MKNALNIFYTLLIGLLVTGTALAQDTKAGKKAQKTAELKRIINGKNFIFRANIALPTPVAGMQINTGNLPFNNPLVQMNSGSIPLTGNYDVKLANDSLIAFLPYYGQAFLAPFNTPNESGIKFTSTKFDYTVTEKKNGNLVVLIKPADLEPRAPSDVQRMILTVNGSGDATLQFINLNRQPISFTGTIEEVKQKQAS